MTVVRRIARPMLAAMFIQGGLDALRHPAAKAEKAAPVVNAIAQPLGLPNDPELMVRANGAAQVAAGSLLALGRVPRLAALVLAGSLVPTTYAGHAFWAVEDPAARAQQRTHFVKNVGLLGGLLLAVVDTAGKPGLSWRARRAAKDAARATALGRREGRHAARSARREARLAASRAHDALT
ncbi:DoxX family protein [Oryzihumus sp.]